MKGRIEVIAETICEEMRARLPGQNKKQRKGLALLVATMLDVRSAKPVRHTPGTARNR